MTSCVYSNEALVVDASEVYYDVTVSLRYTEGCGANNTRCSRVFLRTYQYQFLDRIRKETHQRLIIFEDGVPLFPYGDRIARQHVILRRLTADNPVERKKKKKKRRFQLKPRDRT